MLPIQCLEFMNNVKQDPLYKKARQKGDAGPACRENPVPWRHIVVDNCRRCFNWFWQYNGDYCLENYPRV